ncbi:hypothetical protein NHX12_021683, partial [Muraenolepis orangiensis]
VAAAAQVNLIHPSKCKLSSRPRLSASAHYPQSPLGESLALLTHSKRPSGGGPPPWPKRNKVETCQEEAEEDLTLVAPEAASPDGPHATPPAHRLTKVMFSPSQHCFSHACTVHVRRNTIERKSQNNLLIVICK